MPSPSGSRARLRAGDRSAARARNCRISSVLSTTVRLPVPETSRRGHRGRRWYPRPRRGTQRPISQRLETRPLPDRQHRRRNRQHQHEHTEPRTHQDLQVESVGTTAPSLLRRAQVRRSGRRQRRSSVYRRSTTEADKATVPQAPTSGGPRADPARLALQVAALRERVTGGSQGGASTDRVVCGRALATSPEVRNGKGG